MTNIIAFLHTTTAYKAAALQLMVGQANFTAQQLDLKEPLPIVISVGTNKSEKSEVTPPPWGIGGMIVALNYNFDFRKGYLFSVSKMKWLGKVYPPVTNTLELANQTSLLDTNSAYQLATQFLAKISVDVPKLERKYSPIIFQPSEKRQFGEGDSNNVIIPLFLIGWESQRQLSMNRLQRPGGLDPVFVEILGTTKELLSLHIRDTNFFLQPPLILTNAGELLGPLPPPRHFVEEFLGGKTAYETVANPDKIEAWLLNTYEDYHEKGLPTERMGPKKLTSGIFGTGIDKTFSNILLDFNSYAWTEMKLCSPDFGLRLRYTRGKDVVEFQLCYDCDILEVSHNGHVQQENFDFIHNKLVKAAQSAFPLDGKIRKLEFNKDDARKAYERMLNQ